MATLFFAALTMGMIGSFHCIGMCGPLALSLPLGSKSHFAKFTGSLLYNLGRIATYSILGLLLGLAGKSFSLFGWQQGLSIVTGVVILLLMMLPKKWLTMTGSGNPFTRFSLNLRKWLGSLWQQPGYPSLFLIGVLNGLLPCGLIYMAIAGALATGAPLPGMLFMAAFGLGTLPLMWSISFFGNFISVGIRQKIRSAYPVMMTLIACLLIIRGLGLGIPFLSPVNGQHQQEAIHCYPAVSTGHQ